MHPKVWARRRRAPARGLPPRRGCARRACRRCGPGGVPTVFWLMNSRSAISRLVMPVDEQLQDVGLAGGSSISSSPAPASGRARARSARGGASASTSASSGPRGAARDGRGACGAQQARARHHGRRRRASVASAARKRAYAAGYGSARASQSGSAAPHQAPASAAPSRLRALGPRHGLVRERVPRAPGRPGPREAAGGGRRAARLRARRQAPDRRASARPRPPPRARGAREAAAWSSGSAALAERGERGRDLRPRLARVALHRRQRGESAMDRRHELVRDPLARGTPAPVRAARGRARRRRVARTARPRRRGAAPRWWRPSLREPLGELEPVARLVPAPEPDAGRSRR